MMETLILLNYECILVVTLLSHEIGAGLCLATKMELTPRAVVREKYTNYFSSIDRVQFASKCN